MNAHLLHEPLRGALRTGQSPIGIRRIATLLFTAALAGCSSLGASGPSSASVKHADGKAFSASYIKLVNLDASVTQRQAALRKSQTFADVLGDAPRDVAVIGKGDSIDIAMWEAPPAVLFGALGLDSRALATPSLSQGSNLPQQMVGNDGKITIPFIGSMLVAGKTTHEVEMEIVAHLSNKAHDPQAVVRLVQNEARNVTIVGEVATSRRMSLTARGERVLDAIAAAGGVKQPVGKITIQVSRGPVVASMPLDSVIRDPAQNVRLQPNDVVTALFQPYSFTALGAVNQNAEVPFEGTGMSLAQALGRIGGLRDERANVHGVFLFRFEDADALDPAVSGIAATTKDGKVPVIYRLDLSNPTSFFTAQQFAVHDKDVVYISNAPIADIQKFVNIVSSIAFSAINIGNAVN